MVEFLWSQEIIATNCDKNSYNNRIYLKYDGFDQLIEFFLDFFPLNRISWEV
jgi:hypothetical protein